MPGEAVHVIVIERADRWSSYRRVRAEPDPADGTNCSGTFHNSEKAAEFASQLRRARGWPIINRADQPQAARQAHRG